MANREKERVDTCLKVWDEVALLRNSKRELADLPVKIESFPAKGVDRLDRLGEKIGAQRALCATLADEHDAALRELLNLHVDERPGTVRAGPRAALREGNLRRRPHRRIRSEAANRGHPQEHRHRPFGAWQGLDRAKGILLDRSLFAREEIERRRQALEELRSGRVNAEKSLAARKENLDSAIRDEQEAAKEVERTPAGGERSGRGDHRPTAKREGSIRFHRRRSPGGPKRARGRGGAAASAIREINADWREEEIASFDCSIAARGKVQTFGRMFVDLEAEVRKAEGRIDAASGDLEDAREMVDRKTLEIEKAEPVALTGEATAALKTSLRAPQHYHHP